MGFVESEHYLHVYASYRADPGEPDRAIGQRRPGLRPIRAFLHANLRDERELRKQAVHSGPHLPPLHPQP